MYTTNSVRNSMEKHFYRDIMNTKEEESNEEMCTIIGYGVKMGWPDQEPLTKWAERYKNRKVKK